jgi:hypothetical protein
MIFSNTIEVRMQKAIHRSVMEGSRLCLAVLLPAVLAGCASETIFPVPDACSGSQCDPGQGEGPLQDGVEDARCRQPECSDLCAALGYDTGSCNPSGSCSCFSGEPEGQETCEDGLDNNGNGGVDEGCPCAAGDIQPCYSGPPIARGVGLCIDGIQHCRGSAEFAHWGPCEGDVLPELETCDRIDNDCDGMIDEEAGCSWSCTPGLFDYEVNCSDGKDDDCDGLVDCYDPECSCCQPRSENCTNGTDDDCDTFIDCNDPDCLCCVPSDENCTNGIDDDCDGRTDCSDVLDCVVEPAAEICTNDLDDDCDGQRDCNDSDCCIQPVCSDAASCNRLPCCYPGQTRWCDTPVYCAWGRQTCLPDSHWGRCEETSEKPFGCDTYHYDRECCIAAGQCCHNFPYDDTSVGLCGGIARQCP